jgi:hypothetical protein
MMFNNPGVVTRRVRVRGNGSVTLKPSTSRCAHCGAPMISEREIRFCSEACRDSADDGAAPSVAA